MAGYTRASALGPIADFVEARGGSIERVFRRVDLPLALLDNPDLPLPLSEQFKVLSEAGRDIGDPFFGAALGQLVSMNKLSAFGAWVSSAPTLAGAIDRSARGLNRFLQTETVLRFRISGTRARWSIEFLDPGRDGRFQNELLGVSYLIDGVRHFAGSGWSPPLIRSTCVGAGEAAELEKIFRAPVQHGARVSAVEFDLGNAQIGLGLRDRGFLQGDLFIHGRDRGLASFKRCGRLCDFKPVIFVLDGQQQVALAHRLVFGNRQLTDIARYFRGNGDFIGLQIGIVGTFEVLTLGHPIEPVISTATDNRRCDQGQNDFLHTHRLGKSFWY